MLKDAARQIADHPVVPAGPTSPAPWQAGAEAEQRLCPEQQAGNDGVDRMADGHGGQEGVVVIALAVVARVVPKVHELAHHPLGLEFLRRVGRLREGGLMHRKGRVVFDAQRLELGLC
ncbi:MAG: hypothetical protein IPN11_06370 [Opitutaceae bacterium]|nr:hypothetical protein [Opitutaceae bacterium]